MPDLKISYAIVCDDIRREDTGKLILIGVYSNDIRCIEFPVQISLSFAIGIHAQKPIKVKSNIRMLVNGEQQHKLSGEMDVSSAGAGIFVGPQMPVTFSSPGAYAIQVQVDDSDWVTAVEIPVKALG